MGHKLVLGVITIWMPVWHHDSDNPLPKIRQLVIQNQIIEDSDSKPSKFGQRLYENSDFKVEMVSSIWNSIYFLISYWLNLTKFDLFSIKR